MLCEHRGVPSIAIVLILIAPSRVIAAPPDAPSAPNAPLAPDPRAADRGEKAEADARLDVGFSLFDGGNWAAALAEFREARRLYPLWTATYNAGLCLEKLQRYDEALDMFETLLREFADKMPAADQTRAQGRAAKLRGLVGTIEVESAEPGAAIVIDRQARGHFPPRAPLRVSSGSHVIRVHKEGYEPFEKLLNVTGGTTERVIARLRKLKVTGALYVAEALGRTLEVVVDGISAGKTGEAPLSLPLAPGTHVVFTRGEGNLGTPPTTVTIRGNEVAQLRIEAEVLDASLRVKPVPFDALVSIDSVDLGSGLWEGRVRSGPHKIEVAARGFLPETRTVSIERDKTEVVLVSLSRDPRSPFWRKPPPPPHFIVELGLAGLVGPSFAGDGVGLCGKDCSQGIGLGGYGVLGGGYEWSSGLSFGLSVGYLAATQHTADRKTELNVVGHPGAIPGMQVDEGDSIDSGTTEDVLKLYGFLTGVWVGFSFDAGLPIHLRLGAGGLFGAASDTRQGTFSTSSGKGYPVGPAIEAHDANFFYIMPEVRVGLPLGRHVEINAGLEVPIYFGVSSPTWSEDHPLHAGPDGYGWFNAEAFVGGVFVGLAPTVGARFDF